MCGSHCSSVEKRCTVSSDSFFLGAPLAVWWLATSFNPQYGILSFVVIPFAALWLLLMTLPLLAIGCRRMHDIGRSGLWFVLGVIIPWFAVISLALCCLRSAPAPSR